LAHVPIQRGYTVAILYAHRALVQDSMFPEPVEGIHHEEPQRIKVLQQLPIYIIRKLDHVH
jgi:hypothetical protein